MNNEELAREIADTQVDLAEANESSDLEGRLETATRLSKLLELKEERDYSLNRHTCGLCRGTGIQEDFDDQWECPICKGEGSKVY